jgi:hypothetical protein
MSRTFAGTACLFLLVLALAGSKKDKSNDHREGISVAASVEVFIPGDRRIIQDYVRAHPGGLPPGLAKRQGGLPPGLEKQLRKKGHLPPGLEKKIHPFPPDLERRLEPLAPGLQRGFIAGRAVIYSPKASVVLDVFIP